MPHEDWLSRVRDMLDAIAEIELFIADIELSQFRNDQRTIRAVTYNFVVLGEATRHIPDEVQARYPAIPWPQMRAMRNLIAHEYRRVDPDVLWQTGRGNLPPLRSLLQQLLDKET